MGYIWYRWISLDKRSWDIPRDLNVRRKSMKIFFTMSARLFNTWTLVKPKNRFFKKTGIFRYTKKPPQPIFRLLLWFRFSKGFSEGFTWVEFNCTLQASTPCKISSRQNSVSSLMMFFLCLTTIQSFMSLLVGGSSSHEGIQFGVSWTSTLKMTCACI